MRSFLPAVLAGGSFAGSTIVGLLLGVGAGQHFAMPLLAPAGLMLGGIVGAYSAFRLLAKSIA